MSSKKIAGIIVKLGLDGKEVSKELTAIDKSVAKSAKELKEIDKALKFDPKNTVLLAQKQEILADMLDKSRQKMQALESVQEKMAKAAANGQKWEQAYAPLGEEIDKVREKMNKLRQKMSEMNEGLSRGEGFDQSQYDKYQKELEETTAEMKKLERQKKELEASFEGGHISAEEYRQYKRDLEQVRSETARLEAETQKLDGVTEKSSKAFKEAIRNTKEYKDAMKELEKSSAEAKQKIGELIDFGVKLGAALTSAAVAGVSASVKIGSGFDAAMSSVQALSEAQGADFERLRNAAQKMGAESSKTATESAEALGFMALAGWDVEEMLGGLEPMLRASEAGNLGLARTSDLVTDSMSAMGISVGQLNRYLDITAQAQRSSNTSLEQMLEAYVGAGGMFRQLNTSMEESAALIGVLANRGKKGAEAGNSLNSILINLIGANKNAANAMDALGVSAYDAEGNFIGITETLRLVYASLQECTDEQRNLFTAKIGGKTQYDTLMALLFGVNKEYDDLYKKIVNSNGALEETAKVMRDNLKGDFTTFTSALEDMGIKVNDRFTKEFREAVQVATEEVRKLTSEFKDGDLGDSLEKIAAAFAKCIKEIARFAADKGVPAAVKFFEFIADNGDAITSLIAGIGGAFVAWKIAGVVLAAVKAVTAFTAAVKDGATAVQALSGVLNANPWVLLATAVAGLIAAFVTLAVRSDEVGNRLKEQKRELKELNDEFDRNKKSTEDAIQNSRAETRLLKDKADEYEQLRSIQERTAGQEQRLSDLAEELQQYMPDNIKLIDEETGAYNSLAGSIDGVIAAMRQKARVSAYEQELTELYKQQLDAQETLKEASRDYTAAINNQTYGVGSLYYNINLSTWKKPYEEAEKNLTNINDRIEFLTQNIEKAYSEVSEPPADTGGKNSLADYLGGVFDAGVKAAKDGQSKITKAQEDAYNAFLDKMKELDRKQKIHAIDDTTYWQERRKLINQNVFKESEDWWKLQEDTEKHFSELTEKERQAYEKQIKQQAEALKERKELNDDFTEEMYYNELEKLISALDKESDLYKQCNSEILKGRKKLGDDLLKQTREDNKKQISEAEKSVKEIQSKYSKMLGEVNSEQETYKNKLMSQTKLYTNDVTTDKDGKKSGKFTLESIDEAISAVKKYDNELNKLEKRGAGKNLINYIESQGADDAEYLKKMFGKMSDAELQAYSDKYDELTKTINKRAADRYAPQVQAIEDGFVNEIKAVVGTLPEEMQKVGLDSINGFINGFKGDSAALIEAVSEKCSEVLNTFKDGLDINSPSKETEEIGRYAAEGFEKGLEKVSGAGAAAELADDFIKTMAEKDSQLRDVLNSAFAGNAALAIAKMNEETEEALKNVTAVKLPAGTTLKSGQMGTAGGTEMQTRSDERVIEMLDKLTEYMVTLINAVLSLANKDTVLRAELEAVIYNTLDGAVISKNVTKHQYETKVREGT